MRRLFELIGSPDAVAEFLESNEFESCTGIKPGKLRLVKAAEPKRSWLNLLMFWQAPVYKFHYEFEVLP